MIDPNVLNVVVALVTWGVAWYVHRGSSNVPGPLLTLLEQYAANHTQAQARGLLSQLQSVAPAGPVVAPPAGVVAPH